MLWIRARLAGSFVCEHLFELILGQAGMRNGWGNFAAFVLKGN